MIAKVVVINFQPCNIGAVNYRESRVINRTEIIVRNTYACAFSERNCICDYPILAKIKTISIYDNVIYYVGSCHHNGIFFITAEEWAVSIFKVKVVVGYNKTAL